MTNEIVVDAEGPVLLVALDYAVDQLANFAKRGVSQPYAEEHYKAAADKLGAFVHALIVERRGLADAVESQAAEVERLRARVAEYEKGSKVQAGWDGALEWAAQMIETGYRKPLAAALAMTLRAKKGDTVLEHVGLAIAMQAYARAPRAASLAPEEGR